MANPLVLRRSNIQAGASAIKRFLVEACQNVIRMNMGDKVKAKAATKQNRSSFLISLARKYMLKAPIKPSTIEIEKIEPSTSIPLLAESPAARNG
jgi:hypothetical protein